MCIESCNSQESETKIWHIDITFIAFHIQLLHSVTAKKNAQLNSVTQGIKQNVFAELSVNTLIFSIFNYKPQHAMDEILQT